MGKDNRLNQFVDKWYEYFHHNYVLYDDVYNAAFNYDCQLLGFDLEVGEQIVDNFEDDLCNVYLFTYHLSKFIDVHQLGSLIYYFWNETVGYEYCPGFPLDSDRLAWLLIGLNKLKMLIKNQTDCFNGSISKIHLKGDISKRVFSYNSNVTLFQELIINDEGLVTFKKYGLNNSGKRIELNKGQLIKIDKDKVQSVFDAINLFLVMENAVKVLKDKGTWEATIIDKNGDSFNYNGYLNKGCFYNKELSNYIRMQLGLLDDVFCFDGFLYNFKISKLTLDYNSIDLNNDQNFTKHEKLVFDRNQEMIEYQIEDFTYNATFRFNIDLDDLLDSKDAKNLLRCNNFNVDARERESNIRRWYQLKIETELHGYFEINGMYDYYGLPGEYLNFILFIKRQMKLLLHFDILDNSIANEKVRIINQYILCKVVFDYYSTKIYHFLSKEEDNINQGDHVVVSGGYNNKEVVGKVISVNYYDLKDLPADINKLKYIIRKAEDEPIKIYHRNPIKIHKDFNEVVNYPSDYVVVHVETTGLNPVDDYIIEIGAIKYNNFKEVERFSCLVNPNIAISAKITEISGLTNSDLVNESTIDDVLPQLIAFIAKLPLLGYNVKFEIDFIANACLRLSLKLIDNQILSVANLVRKTISLPNYKLITVKDFLGLTDNKLVNAIDDCVAINEAYIHCVNNMDDN